jgi:hypothetical protein
LTINRLSADFATGQDGSAECGSEDSSGVSIEVEFESCGESVSGVGAEILRSTVNNELKERDIVHNSNVLALAKCDNRRGVEIPILNA